MDKITHPKKRGFLAAYIRCASITRAAKRAQCSREAHYKWMQEDAEYKRAFQEARERAADSLEDLASEMAFDGNATMLIVQLKALRPEKYRERYDMQHSGPGGKPLLDLSSVHEFLRRTAGK